MMKTMNTKKLFSVSFLFLLSMIVTACQTADNPADSAAVNDPSTPLVSRVIFFDAADESWQTVYQTDWMDLASIVCPESQVCLALSEEDSILRSMDSGKSWDKLRADNMIVHSDSPFACASGGFCLLIESINGGNVWVTADHGTTWEQAGTSPTDVPEHLACPSSEGCILISRDGQIFNTQDGGKTWDNQLASSGITYKRITCLNESTCYVAGMLFTGEFGVVAKTTDGGKAWIQAGDSPVRGLRAISCPSLEECISVGRFGVQITEDGGETWRELKGGENGARSVSCSSTQNCFVIDNDGKLLIWDGTNLTKQTVTDEFSLRGISCAPEGKCFIVGAFNDPNLPAQNSANNLNISIGLVFLAGVLSFLSPCVLPVLPGYLTYLAARSSGQDVKRVSRSQVLFHGIAFVVGFSIVFITLGATASAIGQSLYGYKEWITRIGGVLIVFFGLQMSGWLRIPFLEMEMRKQTEANPQLGYISSLLMGVFFSAGWTPCVGPTLGLVLTFAGTEASIAKGVLLLALYSLGLGLPFIITALAMDRVGSWMRRMVNVTRYVTLATGILLVGVGMLLILGKLNFLGELFPGLAIYI
jgi:cytochrome c-type biogenesis protein